MEKFICKLIGHKPETGPLRRSPYTAHTHWRDTDCARCGKRLSSQFVFIDVRLRPDLFKDARD